MDNNQLKNAKKTSKQPGLVCKHAFLSTLLSSALFMGVISPAYAEQGGLNLNAEQRSAMGLQTLQATRVDVYPSATFPALAIIPLNTIRTLSSTVSGTLSQVNVVHGAIYKGQVLAELESAELLEMQANLLTTIASLTLANGELTRAKQLTKSGISSAKKLQSAQASVSQLVAQRAQQLGALRLTGMEASRIKALLNRRVLQSSSLPIVSPIDGQLFDLKVRLGERVAVNQSLFSIGETDPMVLVVRVPVSLVSQLHEGQSVFVKGLKTRGIVEHIDPEVDPMTQSVDIHVEVVNHQQLIRPGQLFSLHFLMTPQFKNRSSALFQIPSNAISQFDGQTAVFIELSDGNKTIKALPIRVMNTANNTLFFTAPSLAKGNHLPTVFTRGSTAIKSAFEAAESDENTSETD